MNRTLPAHMREAALACLPEPPTAAHDPRYISDERVLEALFYQARTGVPWRLLPDCFPSVATIFRRRAEWLRLGVFEQLMERALQPVPVHIGIIDATFIEVQSPLPERAWTKIGNGLKLQVLCDLAGRVSVCRITPASPGEARLAVQLASEAGVLPRVLLGDSAYDINYLREAFGNERCRVITSNDYPRRRETHDPPGYRKIARLFRSRIERTFAWLKAFQAVRTCRARSLATYAIPLALALADINRRGL